MLHEHFRLATQAVQIMGVLRLPNGYDTTETEQRVNSLGKLQAEFIRTGRILVWSGGSDTTVYDTPETNLTFRAWHDLLHVEANLAFTPQGEQQVYQKHMEEIDLYLSEVFTRVQREKIAVVLDAEINGQVQHLLSTGTFPINQKSFMEDYIMKHSRS